MPAWLGDVLPAIGVAVGVYVGIRSDLAALRVIASTAAQRAEQAHARIDLFFQPGGK